MHMYTRVGILVSVKEPEYQATSSTHYQIQNLRDLDSEHVNCPVMPVCKLFYDIKYF